MFLGVNLVVPGVDILKAKYLILRMRHDQSSHWMNRLVEEIRSDAASLKVKHICADPIVLFAILEQRQLTSPVKQAVPKMIAGQKVAGQYDEPIVSYEKALKKARDWTIEFAVPEPTEAMRQELKRIVQWNGFCVWKCEPLFSNA